MKFLQRFYMGLIFFFLYAPILILMIFSFNDSKNRSVWDGFTLRWYEELFHDEQILQALMVTLSVAVLSALISTVLGTAAAIGIHNMKKGPRTTYLTVNNIPVMNPDIITGVSMLLLFVFLAQSLKLGVFQLSFFTLLLAHVTFNTPYVILSVMPKLRQMDPNIYEAALDLGAKPRTAITKVVLPQIMPGVVTGGIMAFTMSLDDVVVSYFTSGSTSQTLGAYIFAMTKKQVSPEINALSTIMFLAVLILLIIVNVRQEKDKQRQERLRKNH